jgi:branched-chain amino acid transport system substrate-binding protein
MLVLPRRRSLSLAGATALAAGIGYAPARAADKIVTIGMSFPLTGSLALQAGIARDAAVYAIEEANAKGTVPGYKLQTLVLDDASTTTGQYDPALAATNGRKMLGDPTVMAAVGPLNSGSAKAVVPVLSQGGLATISGSATNPDLTNPKFASLYRPGGKPVFFRTVTTDAYQGPNLDNYLSEVLNVTKIIVLDDGGAYGVGMADAFAAQAAKKGMDVVIRDRLDPLNADYNTILTKAKSLGVQGLYYGGDPLAGGKLAKQAYEVLPAIPKGGGDGVHTPDMLTGTGMPAIEGWYATSAAAHVLEQPNVQAWAQGYKAKMNQEPADYTITYYDAASVIIDAISRVAKAGNPMTRDNVRDAIQATKLETLQGEIEFDANGDTLSKVVSIYQVAHTDKFQSGDVVHQFRYVGVAPQA